MDRAETDGPTAASGCDIARIVLACGMLDAFWRFLFLMTNSKSTATLPQSRKLSCAAQGRRTLCVCTQGYDTDAYPSVSLCDGPCVSAQLSEINGIFQNCMAEYFRLDLHSLGWVGRVQSNSVQSSLHWHKRGEKTCRASNSSVQQQV